MDLYEVMRTTFAARQFTGDDLPDETLLRIVEHARFAPSGGNRQGWRLIALRDRQTRQRLAELVVPTMQRYIVQRQRGESPWNTVNASPVSDGEARATGLGPEFARFIVEAPVAILACLDLAQTASFDAHLPRVGVISGASIYPLAWNILLAARNEGYGGTLTTFLAPAEAQVRELLGIPGTWVPAALLPLGKPVRQLTRLKRMPVSELLVSERFDGPPLAPAGSPAAG